MKKRLTELLSWGEGRREAIWRRRSESADWRSELQENKEVEEKERHDGRCCCWLMIILIYRKIDRERGIWTWCDFLFFLGLLTITLPVLARTRLLSLSLPHAMPTTRFSACVRSLATLGLLILDQVVLARHSTARALSTFWRTSFFFYFWIRIFFF